VQTCCCAEYGDNTRAQRCAWYGAVRRAWPVQFTYDSPASLGQSHDVLHDYWYVRRSASHLHQTSQPPGVRIVHLTDVDGCLVFTSRSGCVGSAAVARRQQLACAADRCCCCCCCCCGWRTASTDGLCDQAARYQLAVRTQLLLAVAVYCSHCHSGATNVPWWRAAVNPIKCSGIR